MKKIISVISLSAIISFLFSGCYLMPLADSQSTESYVKSKIGVDITGCVIEKDEDAHGGVLGEGTYILIADCSDIHDKMLTQVSGWKSLPMYKIVMRSIDRLFPKFEHGYYYFFNRQRDENNRYLGDKVSGNLRNYTLAVYDTDNDMLYYYEYDS